MPGIEARAPERTETSSGLARSPNVLPVMRAMWARPASTCVSQLLRIGLVVGVVVRADLGGDGEAGRHRQAEVRHLGEVRALAAEQFAHAGAALGLAAAEGVDPLAACAAGLGGGFAGAWPAAALLALDFFGGGRRAIKTLAVSIGVLVTLPRRFLNRLFCMALRSRHVIAGLDRGCTGIVVPGKPHDDAQSIPRSWRNPPPRGWPRGSR